MDTQPLAAFQRLPTGDSPTTRRRIWLTAIAGMPAALAMRATEKEGFEPSMSVCPYSLSRGAPSTTRPLLQKPKRRDGDAQTSRGAGASAMNGLWLPDAMHARPERAGDIHRKWQQPIGAAHWPQRQCRSRWTPQGMRRSGSTIRAGSAGPERPPERTPPSGIEHLAFLAQFVELALRLADLLSSLFLLDAQVDLFSMHRNILWSIDSQANLAAPDTQGRYGDVISDHDALAHASCQYQHSFAPLLLAKISLTAKTCLPSFTPGLRPQGHAGMRTASYPISL